MAVRSSDGKYLEVLESTPALDVGIEVDVFSPDAATMLATLDGASGKQFTRELSELGAGRFAIARSDPKATASVLAIGNLVKFRVGGTHRHAIWIEEPATVVVSTGEEGGEEIRIDGRGALAYLERAAVYPPVWPTAAASIVAWSSADNGSTGTTSLVVPRPTGAAAGDVVVIAVTCVGAAPSTPVGWARIRNVTEGTLCVAVYRARLLAGSAASTTFFWSAATRATGAAVALRNATSDDTTWGISDTSGSGTAVKLPSVSVGLVDGVLLGIAAVAASTTVAPGAGLTEAVDRAATGRTLEAAWRLNPALGDTGDLTATAGVSAGWIGLQVVVPSTASADASFDGATFGAVLLTLIDAAKARGALPALTVDFTAAVDSHGQPWPDVHDLSFHIGTSLLEVWRHLVTLGLEGGMTPGLRLQAFVDAARHFESSVILRKGHHLSGDVVDTAHSTGLRTRILAEGAGGRMVEIADPALEADTRIGRREGFLSLSTSDNPTTLQRAGEHALAAAAAEDQARSLTVEHGTAAEGHFEPWVDYREGDWIGLDAEGSGGVPVAQRVMSITLAETEAGDYGVELELNSVEMDAFLRLQRRLDALSRDSTASGSGGGSGGTSAGASGRVASVSTDAPGFLFDKLTTDSSLTKALVGDAGSQRVRLGVAPGGTHPDLSVHDALGLATDAELASHAAAADPHTGYRLEADDHSHASTGLQGGTVAYSAITGTPAAERAASSTTPAAVGTAAVGVGTTDARADHVHATSAGTPSTQAFGDAAAIGAGPAAAMTDHKHAMPALGTATPTTADATAGAAGTAVSASASDHRHLGHAQLHDHSTAADGTALAPVTVATTSALAADIAIQAKVAGDVVGRLNIDATGKMAWSDGAAAADVTLYRAAADKLSTDDMFQVRNATGVVVYGTGGNVLRGFLTTADTNPAFYVGSDGGLAWGPGGATAIDTNLYRSAANVLKTDYALHAAGHVPLVVFTTTAGPTLAMATANTWYKFTGMTTPSADPSFTPKYVGQRWVISWNFSIFSNVITDLMGACRLDADTAATMVKWLGIDRQDVPATAKFHSMSGSMVYVAANTAVKYIYLYFYASTASTTLTFDGGADYKTRIHAYPLP
jgi:hypothetical protein